MPARAHPPATAPPTPTRAVTHTFPQDRRSVGRARHALRERLAIWHIGSEVSDDAVLLLSELVTNAVRAKVTGCRTIGVRFELTDRTLRLEVSDGSGQRPTVRRQTTDEDECGRGLVLVDVLADHWGVEPLDAGGKVVWVLLALPDGCPAPASATDESPHTDGGHTMAGKSVRNGQKTATEELKEAERVYGELLNALRDAGIVLPSLHVSTLSYAEAVPRPLIELGGCNLPTARALTSALRAPYTAPAS